MRKPTRVFFSPLTNRFYATAHYKAGPNGTVIVTGAKYDVTQDIAAAVVENEVEFAEIASPDGLSLTRGDEMTTVRIHRIKTIGELTTETIVEVSSPSDIMADVLARNVVKALEREDATPATDEMPNA